ncbi:hypothetical protein N7471_011372 [Penicillium samsonianum]|uniref:uncharacterized protein n=1 Tax=Penicillium samsonianum TaxID=1882272 RepID=UPI00254695D8|nr:uncharacterized protein N7471_011372 [Penicillium samsonianum]KAJ6124055.1 hypothetical protein N7471_011372 [Penicillium samsonianum]
MAAANRLESLAAACKYNARATTFLRQVGEHGMTESQAATLFTRTSEETLPSFMNLTLSLIQCPADAAATRDALRFAAAMKAFTAALDEEPQQNILAV